MIPLLVALARRYYPEKTAMKDDPQEPAATPVFGGIDAGTAWYEISLFPESRPNEVAMVLARSFNTPWIVAFIDALKDIALARLAAEGNNKQ